MPKGTVFSLTAEQEDLFRSKYALFGPRLMRKKYFPEMSNQWAMAKAKKLELSYGDMLEAGFIPVPIAAEYLGVSSIYLRKRAQRDFLKTYGENMPTTLWRRNKIFVCSGNFKVPCSVKYSLRDTYVDKLFEEITKTRKIQEDPMWIKLDELARLFGVTLETAKHSTRPSYQRRNGVNKYLSQIKRFKDEISMPHRYWYSRVDAEQKLDEWRRMKRDRKTRKP